MQYSIHALLAVIAIAEIYRIYQTRRTPTKRDHYRNKLEGVKKMIWDLEFKLFKTREIREEIRQTYDGNNARAQVMEAQIKDWPEGKPIEEKGTMEDQLVLIKRDNERFEAQMRNLDVEMEGTKPTNEYPEGVEGIKMQVDNLQELKTMLEDWIKNS